jgi:hypothetical protein
MPVGFLIITPAGWNKFPPLTVQVINTSQFTIGGGHVQENAFCPANSDISFRGQ